PLEVDGEHALPALLGSLEEVAPARRGNAGVVDEHIDPAPVGQDGIDQAFALGRHSHVGAAKERGAPPADQGLRVPCRLLIPGIIDGDGIAVACQLQADALADPAAAAGDQGHRLRALLSPRHAGATLYTKLSSRYFSFRTSPSMAKGASGRSQISTVNS